MDDSITSKSDDSGLINSKKVLYTELSPNEKNIVALKNEVQELKELVKSIQTQQLSKELHLSIDDINDSGEIKPMRRTKRGKGAIPLLESELLEAQEKTKTAVAAAEYLNVNYYTYRRYALMFGIWKTNATYRKEGIQQDAEKGKYPLSRILNGEFPDYPVFRLKDKLINGNVKKPECEQCGYKERRITDGKMPLIINFEDGNNKNHRPENIKLYCYNCTFCCGKGYIRKGKKYSVFDDPDRAQGAKNNIPSRF